LPPKGRGGVFPLAKTAFKALTGEVDSGARASARCLATGGKSGHRRAGLPVKAGALRFKPG